MAVMTEVEYDVQNALQTALVGLWKLQRVVHRMHAPDKIEECDICENEYEVAEPKTEEV